MGNDASELSHSVVDYGKWYDNVPITMDGRIDLG